MGKPKTHYLPTTILLILAVLVWVFMASDAVAWHAATYADSAHGDPDSGVNRSDAVYPTGSCAHCHDTFNDSICGNDPNGLMLFAPRNPASQTDNFCFQCHCDPVDSQQVDMAQNKDYGSTFGGGTATFTNIYDAFNASGSSHDLAAVQSHALSTWGIDWMTPDTNACLVCHDPHLSQKNFPVQDNAMGGVNTAVRRGNDVVPYPGNIWGDQPLATSGVSEMMSDWTSEYQAPYFGDTSDPDWELSYEPDGSMSEPTNGWGSNLPNFVTACAQTCHRKAVSGLTDPINWMTSTTSSWPGTPDQHGRYSGTGSYYGNLKPPYDEQPDSYNYVLSCTDCHEPHGSTNPRLLRTTVNGVPGLSVTGRQYYYWCQACHDIDTSFGVHGSEGINPTTNCGSGGGCHWHGQSGLF
jgi:hypothetical protein